MNLPEERKTDADFAGGKDFFIVKMNADLPPTQTISPAFVKSASGLVSRKH